MTSHSRKIYEISSIIESIEKQFWKNEEMYKVISNQSNNNFQRIHAIEFLQEIQQQLKQPKQSLEQIMGRCQEMVDKLLDEEYTLDRMVSKLNTKKRRNVKISTGNVLQAIDENVQKELLLQGPKTTGKNKYEKFFSESIENNNNKIQNEIQNNPIEELQLINLQIKECLELIDQNIGNKIINNTDMENENNKLKDELQKIKENKIYDDENMEVFIVYKNNTRKLIPQLQINY